MRLGILASHPIQYQSPWYRELAKNCDLEVFFGHQQTANEQGLAGFGIAFDWDIDLFNGYKFSYLRNISRYPGVNRYSDCDTPEISGIIKTGKFDAFIVNGWYLKSYRQAMRACRSARVPVLVRGDSQLRTPRSCGKRMVMEVRQRWLLRQFDGFLTVGKRNREYLEHFGVPTDRIFFAPHFVDNMWFESRSWNARAEKNQLRHIAHHSGEFTERPTYSSLRTHWGADETTLVVLFVGKFIPKKRPADILMAIAHLEGQENNGGTSSSIGEVCRNQSYLAVFVGSGELDDQLRATATFLGVKSQFVGFKNQTELPACYAAADVIVLPSDGGETWGLVINEAMACGIPAIVSDAVGCAPDLIVEGETGFTFPLGDFIQLADRLSRVAKLKEAWRDFTTPLKKKMRIYCLEEAVAGTLQALRFLA